MLQRLASDIYEVVLLGLNFVPNFYTFQESYTGQLDGRSDCPRVNLLPVRDVDVHSQDDGYVMRLHSRSAPNDSVLDSPRTELLTGGVHIRGVKL